MQGDVYAFILSVDVKAEFCLPFVGIFKIFEMDKNNINLFELLYDDIIAMKKRDLVDQIKKRKGKVVKTL